MNYLDLSFKAACAIMLLLAPTVEAGILYTNSSVPADMDAGGSESDQAEYIVGYGSSYNKSLGTNAHVGPTTSYNKLTVQNSSQLDITGNLSAGTNPETQQNSIIVSEASSVSASGTIVIGGKGRYNTMAISGGSEVSSGSFVAVGISPDNLGNAVTVNGFGSILNPTDSLRIGQNGIGNTLTIEADGLVKVGGDGDLSIGYSPPTVSGNALRLNGGFLALEGEHFGDILPLLGQRIQVWDGAAWAAGNLDDNVLLNYFATDAEALSFSGYDGLGGYTILTSIPEPEQFAMMIGAAGLLLAIRRRR